MNDVYTDNIANASIEIILGDLTQVPADAYVVPQFKNGASFGGVGGSVARSGALTGMQEYDTFVSAQGTQPFGKALLNESGGGNAKYLAHVVSVGSGRENEFCTIQTCIVNALGICTGKGLATIATPALGTGIIGDLTSEQSARAMLSAVHEHIGSHQEPFTFKVVIYGDRAAFNAFVDVLKNKLYLLKSTPVGGKVFDMDVWLREMKRDAKLNQEAFGK